MDGVEDTTGVVDRNKKQRTIDPLCSSVSALTNSVSECIVQDVTYVSGESQVQEVHGRISREVSNDHCGKTVYVEESKADSLYGSISGKISEDQDVEDSETLNEIMAGNVSSNALDKGTEDIAPKMKLVHSTPHQSLSVQVGASLIRFIRGKGGSTQKSIEEEFGVKIILPSSKKEDSITIEGSSMDGVTGASAKIQNILDKAVKSPNLDYSHFISLPLAIHPDLVEKLVNFQNSILGNTDSCLDECPEGNSNDDESNDQESDEGQEVAVRLKVKDDNEHVKVDVTSIPIVSHPPKRASKASTLSVLGIDKSIFIKPKTFHLTVLMLKLWNKELVTKASKVLQSVSSKVVDALNNRPVFVRLKGLDCMRGSLVKARVLYACVEEVGNEDRLIRACQTIIDAFVEAGLVPEKDAKHKLKLHATVMNARHRKRKRRLKKADSFDARRIFEQFGSKEWGEYLIREAHLSRRFMYDENGYYHCCASIPFPVD